MTARRRLPLLLLPAPGIAAEPGTKSPGDPTAPTAQPAAAPAQWGGDHGFAILAKDDHGLRVATAIGAVVVGAEGRQGPVRRRGRARGSRRAAARVRRFAGARAGLAFPGHRGGAGAHARRAARAGRKRARPRALGLARARRQQPFYLAIAWTACVRGSREHALAAARAAAARSADDPAFAEELALIEQLVAKQAKP